MIENKKETAHDDTRHVEAPNQPKEINPALDADNYYIIIKAKGGQVIRTLVVNNATVTVGLVGEQSLIAELK